MGIFGSSRRSTTNQTTTQIDNSIAAGEAARVNVVRGNGNVINDASMVTDLGRINADLQSDLFGQAMGFANNTNEQALRTASDASAQTSAALKSFGYQLSNFATSQNPQAGNQKVLMAGVAAVGIVSLFGVMRK